MERLLHIILAGECVVQLISSASGGSRMTNSKGGAIYYRDACTIILEVNVKKSVKRGCPICIRHWFLLDRTSTELHNLHALTWQFGSSCQIYCLQYYLLRLLLTCREFCIVCSDTGGHVAESCSFTGNNMQQRHIKLSCSGRSQNSHLGLDICADEQPNSFKIIIMRAEA